MSFNDKCSNGHDIIGKLITISNSEYDVQVNSKVFKLNESQFNKLIQVPDTILNLLNKPDKTLIVNHKQLIDYFLESARVLYFDGNMEYEVLQAWRQKLGFNYSNNVYSTNHDNSLEYGCLYLGGDWRDDYDARY